MNKNDKIYVAGHKGMVGSALVRLLQQQGYNNLLLRSRAELDLCDQKTVLNFFLAEQPAYVFMAAAKVGGINANNIYRGSFLYNNLAIQNNVIHSAYLAKVKKLLFLGSSCIYPKLAPQPIKEDYLLTGPLEPTNEPYAIAKIAGIKMCQAYRQQYNCNFISAMPSNLYGPNDNYDLENSHVLPALLRKFHEAKIKNDSVVEIWGTGNAYREFMHVDDLAEACLFLMLHYNQPEFVNVGTGTEISIKDLALLVKQVTGYTGNITFNTTRPDGPLRKLLDVSRLKDLGWQYKIKLNEGVINTYASFLKENYSL